MPFQIHALPAERFRHLFDLSDDELARLDAERVEVTEKPGFPCRVCLQDAEIGETVILLQYEHLRERSPYRSSHAIFVREGVKQAQPLPGQVPEMLRKRLLSVRAFDQRHRMIGADVAMGNELEGVMERLLAEPAVDYLHLHSAKPGCYEARVTRA